MPAKYVLKKGSTGKFRFNLFAANGKVIATSEAYESKRAAMLGIDSVRKSAGAPLVDETQPAATKKTAAAKSTAGKKTASASTRKTTTRKSTARKTTARKSTARTGTRRTTRKTATAATPPASTS